VEFCWKLQNLGILLLFERSVNRRTLSWTQFLDLWDTDYWHLWDTHPLTLQIKDPQKLISIRIKSYFIMIPITVKLLILLYWYIYTCNCFDETCISPRKDCKCVLSVMMIIDTHTTTHMFSHEKYSYSWSFNLTSLLLFSVMYDDSITFFGKTTTKNNIYIWISLTTQIYTKAKVDSVERDLGLKKFWSVCGSEFDIR